MFTVPAAGATPGDPAIAYSSGDRPPFYVYWSPDGRALSFLTTEIDGLALRLAPADASAPAAVVRTGAPMYWSWADPSRLLVHSGGEGLAGFFGEVRPDGVATEPTAILAGSFRVPAVSSDGRFRAFATPGEATPEQIVLETRDRATSQALDVFGPAAVGFGQGSDELAFVAAAEPGSELRPAGRTAAPHGRDIGRRAHAARWQGHRLLLGTGRKDGRSPVGSGAGRRQRGRGGSRDARRERLRAGRRDRREGATLVPDGRDGGDPFAWDVRPLRQLRRQVLPYFDQYALSHRVWSPDSASIALPVVAEGTEQVVVVQADGSGARRVADGVEGFWSP